DRFMLSNGHGSMLLYALLHLSGYAISIEDIKNFRQFGSVTAGHPELETPGVETTTGPLGQGLANAVGMALAERNLASEFNRDGFDIISHHTYVFVGDGCLMEGISHEACSLAGTLGLGKLICFFDDNGISIDGEVKNWCHDDVRQRFEAYNWNVIGPIDGHNHQEIEEAITTAHSDNSKPTLIICKTHIGYGSPNKVDTAGAHGAALGDEEINLMRKELSWEHPPFVIPDEVYGEWDMKSKGTSLQEEWQKLYEGYQANNSQEASELDRRLSGKLPESFTKSSEEFIKRQNEQGESIASRQASLQAINHFTSLAPEIIGGSADLGGSNYTIHKNVSPIDNSGKHGNYINYGVRELAMSAIMNGISLHKGYIPYGGTFLVFLDYSRSAVRLAALMNIKVVFIFSHDSIGVGEDGPTHQPVEHLSILRHTPNVRSWRPADTVETAVAWLDALQGTGPSSLVISRQKLNFQQRDEEQINNIIKGGYSLISGGDSPEFTVIATGSELEPARQAVVRHNQEGRKVRLVSMPCCERFDEQDDNYKQKVFATEYSKRLAVEAASADYWKKYADNTLGMNGFGMSAPAGELFKHFGLTEDSIYARIKELL
ncbi:MAG: transketolase, partial [Candidatus Portiera sp.]|nr:transketolase [Portiera sp.]